MAYQSQLRLLGLPLVHIATGQIDQGRYRRGIARGWIAIGGAAFGWIAAVGGLAVAHDVAVGGRAVAAHANDPAARQFWHQTLPQLAGTVLRWGRWVGLLLLVALAFVLRSADEAPSASRRGPG